jgi:hypothetical protein
MVSTLEKAGKAGGITALLEDRISLFPDAFEAERANVKFIFDTFRKDELGAGQPMPASDTHSAFLCALGAAEMTTGAGWIGVAVVETIITGGLGAPKGAVLAGAGSALLGSGTALVSSQC